MIKIGDFAKICNVSTQTLRYYDAEGLLKADVTDALTGYRFYSLDAVEKYKQIVFYKNLGFSLEEIKRLQAATKLEVREMLLEKKETLSKSIDRFGRQIRIIDEICTGKNRKPALTDVLLLPFENDPDVVGEWELCGRLTDENDWSTLAEVGSHMADREIIFMAGGAFAWKYFWTRGTLYRISHKYTFAIPNAYRTVKRDGERYMLLQFMTDDCVDRGEDTVLLLYRQVDCVAYTEHQIRPHIDRTDLPFEDDAAVHGNWMAIDFVSEISDFDPVSRMTDPKKLFISEIRFHSRGICTRTVRTGTGYANRMLRYTKGVVLNDREMTAEAYRIERVGDKDFLFVEHKSGDYYYGGMTPHWYVFYKVEADTHKA